MQDCIIYKHNKNGVAITLPRPLVLSQLHDVVANTGKADFPVQVELIIVDSGGGLLSRK